MAFYRGPRIVTSGLVLALDAANPKSYAYGSTLWNDLSGNLNSGSLNNAPALNNDGVGSLVFNANVSNSVSIPNPVQDDFTLSCWFKTTQSVGSNGQWYTGAGLIDGFVAPTTNDFGLAIVGGRVAFGIGRGQSDTTISSSLQYNNDRWYQATATRIRSSGVITLYINGSLITTITSSAVGPMTATSTLRVGSINTNIQFFSGSISNVQVYNRALSAAEVAQNYNAIGSRFQYPLANISTYLTLTQAAGLSIYDNTIENTTYLARYSSYASASAFALVNEPII
jgi:hypothetical protein